MTAVKPISLLLLWFAFVQVALGANVSVTVSPPKIEVGQSTTLQVVVTGGQPRGVPTIEVSSNIELKSTGRRQSFSSTLNAITHIYQFDYRVLALEAGVATIGPVSVELVAGGHGTASSLSIQIEPRGSTPRPKENLEVLTKFSRDTIWEGEVVHYEAQLTSRLAIQDVSWRLPAFEGLQRAPHGDEYRTRQTIGDPDGDFVVLKTVIPLVATGTGDRTQPPPTGRASLLTDQKGFFGRRRVPRNVVGQRAPLLVKPLPKAPDAFSGLVGNFEVVSTLGKGTPVRVGESVPWVVRILGNGVIDGLELKLPAIEGVEIYQDGQETIGRTNQGSYVAQKTFKMVLVPVDGGVVEVPSVPIVVFDAKKGAYTTLKTPSGRIEVRGEGTEAEVEIYTPDGKRVEDAAPIEVAGLYTLGFSTTPPLAPAMPILLALVGFPGMLLLLIDGGTATTRWLGSRLATKKSQGPRGKQRLRDLPPEGPEQLRVLDLALREALADQMNVDVAALHRDAALRALERADAVRHAFQLLDDARFAGADPDPKIVSKVKLALEHLQ